MLDVVAAGSLVGPWFGVWDLVLDSPEASITLAAVLFTMAMTGIGLAVFGESRREEPVQTVAVVVQAPRRPRRVRRRR
jgi:hypothetical protein